MSPDRTVLADKVLQALRSHPGHRAWPLATKLNAEKKLINSVLFRELKKPVQQDH